MEDQFNQINKIENINKQETIEKPVETMEDISNRQTLIIENISRKELIIKDTEQRILNIQNELGLAPSNEVPPSIQAENELIIKLKEEKNTLEEKKIDPKEEWRKSAKENFGIDDFDVSLFKRDLLNEEKAALAFSEGKDWVYIYDNFNEFFKEESYVEANKAFERMNELETEIPGSVKILHEKWGITNYQRYPKEILANQLKEIDKEKGVALLAFGKEDHNGAFDNQQILWDKIYKGNPNLNFRVVECGSVDELTNQFKKAKEDYEKNISLTIISAHGDKDDLYLSDRATTEEEMKRLIEELKSVLDKDSQIIGNACSSGQSEGWIQKVSKEIGIEAIGPDRPAGIQDIEFYGNGKILPKYYENNINSNYYKGFLLSKKK